MYYQEEITFADKIKNFFEFLGELFIDAHTLGFQMIGEFSETSEKFGQNFAIMDIILAIMLIICVLVFDLFILFLIYLLIEYLWIKVRTKEIKESEVTGKIIEKYYKPAHSTMVPIMAGKVVVMSPRHCPEKYNVVVQYQNITDTIDNEPLYNNCKENDDISLILVQKLDKHGKLIEATLSLPE